MRGPPSLPLVLLGGCWLTGVELSTKLGSRDTETSDTEVAAADTDPGDSDTEAPDTDLIDDSDPADTEASDPPTADLTCADRDLATATGSVVATGTLAGAVDDHRATCSERSGGEDEGIAWMAPRDGCWVFDTSGSVTDTVMSVFSECRGEELACSDDVDFDEGDYTSEVHLPASAGDQLLVIIDGWSASAIGDWQLNIREGDPLEPDLSVTGLGQVAAGDNLGQDDSIPGPTSPGGCSGDDGRDVLIAWTAPLEDSYSFSLTGTDFDAVLSLHRRCDRDALACDDQLTLGAEQLELDMLMGETIIVRIAGYLATVTPEVGTWRLTVARH